MYGFPSVDPIPLPAPVWLFKVLHILTLALHFIAVDLILGGLLIAILLNMLSRSSQGKTAAAALARRLPVVMTYVINLGVPPLLFAQVLYGRALYTSSVLIGAYWISVIFLLMGCYWLLYRFSAGVSEGRNVWWLGFAAWLLASYIARIYASNMTLMLRPEVWPSMYSNSPFGTHLPTGDPTILPRWCFMITGGFVMSGLWMLYLSARKSFSTEDGKFLAALGGKIAGIAALLQTLVALWVIRTQPTFVQHGLSTQSLYKVAGMTWLILMAVILILGTVAGFARLKSNAIAWASMLMALLTSLSMTIFRDGIRDLTLLSKGYDVWQRTIVTNWSVVGLFLLLFVAGLGVLLWLISVVARAQKVMESVVES